MTVYKLINTYDRNKAGTMANKHFMLKNLCMPSIMTEIVNKKLKLIKEGSKCDITVSRRKSMLQREKGQIDHDGRWSIFGQVYKEHMSRNPDFSYFRHHGTDKRCWKMDFKGEGSIDAGGPFRDTFSNFAEELEAGVIPLLIKTPNNRLMMGNYRECYVLDPASTSPTHMNLYSFLGGILGYSILSMAPLPINLAPIVWKQLIGD